MTSAGAPNDLLGNFNPLTIIIFTPLFTHGLYPFLSRRNIKFGRIHRIATGFITAAVSGVIGGIVQWRVYKTSPCGYYASTCDGVSPISIWWQLPNVILGAISEIFVNITGYELAYARAPPSMKSIVFALCLFTTALSTALSELLIPAIKDPHLIVGTSSVTPTLAAADLESSGFGPAPLSLSSLRPCCLSGDTAMSTMMSSWYTKTKCQRFHQLSRLRESEVIREHR